MVSDRVAKSLPNAVRLPPTPKLKSRVTAKLPVPVTNESAPSVRVFTFVVVATISRVPPVRVSVRLKAEFAVTDSELLEGIVKFLLAIMEVKDTGVLVSSVTGSLLMLLKAPMRTFELATGTDPPRQLFPVFQELSVAPVQQMYPARQSLVVVDPFEPSDTVIVFSPSTLSVLSVVNRFVPRSRVTSLSVYRPIILLIVPMLRSPELTRYTLLV